MLTKWSNLKIGFQFYLKLNNRLFTFKYFYKHVCTLIILLSFNSTFSQLHNLNLIVYSLHFFLYINCWTIKPFISITFSIRTDHIDNSRKFKTTLKKHLLSRWPSYLTSNTPDIDLMTDLRPGTPIAEIQWKIGFIVINGLIFITFLA